LKLSFVSGNTGKPVLTSIAKFMGVREIVRCFAGIQEQNERSG